MYQMITAKDSVRIPPKYFDKPLEESAKKALQDKYESRIDQDLGVIISVDECREIKNGKIIQGDGSAYYEVIFNALTFNPKLHEPVRGYVNEIVDFGAFVRFGPIDALAHVSQITDDYMTHNQKTGALSGKETDRSIKKDDKVRARIIAVSLKDNVNESKINLTMKQPGLGKKEWIEEEKENKEKSDQK